MGKASVIINLWPRPERPMGLLNLKVGYFFEK